MDTVWCVFTEHGEYEQWSRNLRGVFATSELAEAHAAQLREHYDVSEVIEEDVLTAVPASVPYIRWSAHITPDGNEHPGSGYVRGTQFTTWSNEITSAEGRLGPWSGHARKDLYIEVLGCDEKAVANEYHRLLALAREQLQT